MTELKSDISPQTSYVVVAAGDFANFNLQTLLDYYQPLMSPHTLGLFLALRAQLTPNPLVTNAKPLSSLLSQVNSGFNQVKEAFKQLEGLRLLKTFRQAEDDLLVFELQPTLTPVDFINDDLLSVLCLQMVGDQRFKQLGMLAKQYQLDVSSYQNISHSFFDAFTVDRANQTIDDPAIEKARVALDKMTNQRVDHKALPDDDFDFHFLAQQLVDQGVSEDEIQANRQLILTEHLVYGYDELTIAKLFAQAVDLVSGKFNSDQFKSLARSYSPTNKKKAPDSTSLSERKKVTAGNDHFSDQERSLIHACEQTRPIDFLRQLKQQTASGYVSPSEKNTVERLVSNLNPAAVNVLIWYIIGERGNSSLGANFADAIANNWLQQGVNDAASALTAAKNYQKNRQKLQTSHKKTYRRKKAVHEKLPKWAQPGYEEKNEEASPEQAAAMRRLLMQGEQKGQLGERGENDESSK